MLFLKQRVKHGVRTSLKSLHTCLMKILHIVCITLYSITYAIGSRFSLTVYLDRGS